MKIELETIGLGFNADNLKKGDHLIVKEGIAVGILPSEFINMLPKEDKKPAPQQVNERFVLFRSGKILVKPLLEACLEPTSFASLYDKFPDSPTSNIRGRIYSLLNKGMVDVSGEGRRKRYQTNAFGKHYLDGASNA
jgi:hypothetical protein